MALDLYTEAADAVYNHAVAAGATVRMPMMDAFWGDRCGDRDPDHVTVTLVFDWIRDRALHPSG